MAIKINYKAEFEGFRQTAEDAEWYPAIATIYDASINATDTFGSPNGNNEADWYECAYYSICETSEFNASEMVRKVFSGMGYSW